MEALAIDPSNSATLYAGAGSAIQKSIDRGASWTVLYSAPPPYLLSVFSIAIGAASPQTVLACGSINSLIVVVPTAIFRSADGGASWTQVGLSSSQCAFVVADPGTPHLFYSGSLTGLIRTRDDGLTWEALPVPSPPNTAPSSLVIDPRDSNALVLGLTGAGILRSRDGGASWEPGNAGLAPAGRTPSVAKLAADPSDSTLIYAAGASYTSTPFTFSPDFLRSQDGGSSWTSIAAAAGTPNVKAITTSPASTRLVSIATSDRGVLQSYDRGNTWTAMNAGLPGLTVDGLWASPSEAGTLYAAASGGLFRLDPCGTAGGPVLCLDGRFKVEVAFRSGSQPLAAASPTMLTANTGAFWFFTADNLELVIKVLDGRSVNGKWWVFYGALSNVEYTITVTDTQTGAVRTYFNPQGTLASVADTSAF